jgi:class 3 adenylate cyclase
MDHDKGKVIFPFFPTLLRLRTYILSLFVFLVIVTGGTIALFGFWVESNEARGKGKQILSLLALDTNNTVETLLNNIQSIGESISMTGDKLFKHLPSEEKLSQLGYGFVIDQPFINSMEFIDELTGTSVLVMKKAEQVVTQISKKNAASGKFQSISYLGNLFSHKPASAQIEVPDPRTGKIYQTARASMLRGWSDMRQVNEGPAGSVSHIFSYLFMLKNADGSPMGLASINISLQYFHELLAKQSSSIGYDGYVIIAERNRFGKISVLGGASNVKAPIIDESQLLFTPADHPDSRVRAIEKVLTASSKNDEDLFNMPDIKFISIRSDDGSMWDCAIKGALTDDKPDCLIVTMARQDLLLANAHLHVEIQGAIITFILLVGGAVGWRLAGRMAKPMEALAVDIAAICQGDIRPSGSIDTNICEIAELGRGIEILKAGLITLRRYSPHQLVDQIVRTRREAELFVERRELTLFFSDIEGFTTISETLLPNQMLALTSDFLASFTKAIQAHSGNVDKFIGDSVMAFWNAPLPEKDHALLACLAALDCQEAINQINSRSIASGLPAIRARIGIHSGMALVGNIGSEDRMNYTAMGDTVNLASRLEGANKQYGTTIMISESTKIAAGSGIETRPIDLVAVKGKSNAIMVHELIGQSGQISAQLLRKIELTKQGWNHYIAKQFKESRLCYASVIAETGEDPLARLFIERCAGLEAHPPGNDWIGEMHMTTK